MASRRSGPLRLWRIAEPRYPVYDGGGAARFGARWNSPGRFAIYASETYAGALLECLVHANIGIVPRNHVFVEITVPRQVAVEIADPKKLPGWDEEDCLVSRRFGDRWFDENRTCVLLVPSVITRVEYNAVINQRHPDFRLLGVTRPQAIHWDRRLDTR